MKAEGQEELRYYRRDGKKSTWFADEKIDPTLTDIKDKHERATAEYWRERVEELGNHKSPFLDMPQEEIDAFTVRHKLWVEPWVKGKDVLEIGCGYGRTMDMFKEARIYVGIECVDELITEAWDNWERIFGRWPGKVSGYKGGIYRVDLKEFRQITTDGHPVGIGSPLATNVKFDICVAIAVISSVEPYFHNLRRRILDMLKPGGVIMWLEEDYTRIDYK